MKKTKTPDDGPRCGSCSFWRHEDGAEIGECFFNPPGIQFGDDGEYFLIRPVVDNREPACGQFRPVN